MADVLIRDEPEAVFAAFELISASPASPPNDFAVETARHVHVPRPTPVHFAACDCPEFMPPRLTAPSDRLRLSSSAEPDRRRKIRTWCSKPRCRVIACLPWWPADGHDRDSLVVGLGHAGASGDDRGGRRPGRAISDRLFLGSEGTLGVICEAWMRLQARPRWQVTASVAFHEYGAAVTATRTIAQSGLFPSNCRLLDSAEAFLNAGTSVRGRLLVLAFESADHPVDSWLDRALAIVRDHGGKPLAARDRDGRQEDAASTWRSSFLRMPYHRDVLARRSMIVETFETACTWDDLGTLYAAVTRAADEAVQEVCGFGFVTCRFTHVYPDGAAPYFSIYAPGRWGSTLAQWDDIKTAVSDAIETCGGTITHHHAVGRDHRPWYDRQRPDVFASALGAAKSALDPADILNPGVLLGGAAAVTVHSAGIPADSVRTEGHTHLNHPHRFTR